MMASKKSVGSMQQRRNKEGVLELEKAKGLKKTWKPYTFKVSASTYLLYFKSDMTSPERQLLLAEVTKVLPSAVHGASFPFEVHFRGKGSPWKLNAGSNEERMSWMDAIFPGSSSSVTRFQQMRENVSPPLVADTSPQATSLPPPYTLTNTTPTRKQVPHCASLGSDPRSRADPNPYIVVPKTTASSKDLAAANEPDDDDMFLTASLGAPHNAQNYLVPSENPQPGKSATVPKPHARPRHSSSDSTFTRPVPSPRPKARPRTPRHVPPAPELSKVNSEDDYIKMMSSPIKKSTLQTTVSEGEPPQYLEVVSDDHDPTLDEDNYVIPNSPPNKPVRSSNSLRGAAASPQGAESGGGASGNLVDTISQHFNKEQIGMLIQMLQEVRVDKRQTAEEEAKAWEVRSPASPSSPAPYSSEDSITLRGNLFRALSYAPNFSEGILVTEEDSDESYEQRPQWAKAVPANGHLPSNHPEQQLDTLTNLQQEALYLSKKDIRDLKIIGHGQFGEVFKGVLQRGLDAMPVAVKMTKKTISDYLQESFLKEISIMSQMMHPNIVRLYGIVSEDVPSPWIVLEYMEHGDLKSFLTKNKRSVQQMVKYMVDVAMGMHYVSERGLVHRDLAARNVLVGSNEICKVADFGLLREIPRDLSVYTASHSIPCPIRWMPPESVSDREFSAASDVWSFGVLVWEMFNPTKLPFEKYDNMAVVSKVNEGLRLPVPRGAPSIVAKIMKACCHRNPSKRPSFLLISTLLSTRTSF